MKRAARTAGVNLALILAVLALAELTFGEWFSATAFGTLNIPRNERRVFDTANLYAGGGETVYTRDALGFRGHNVPDPAEVDMVALGGSTTNERYLDDSKTWVARLERKFGEAGANLTIANAAIDGQTSIGHLAALELWLSNIPDFRPRYAIVYVGINDASLPEDESLQYDTMMSPDPARRARQFIMNRSALYTLFRTVRGTWLARAAHIIHNNYDGTERWERVERIADPDALRARLSARLEEYAQRLTLLAERLRRAGASPIFVTQRRGDHRIEGGAHLARAGRFSQAVIEDSASRIAAHNSETRRVCRTLGILCIDLAQRLEFSDEDFYDGVHTTPSGSEKIAAFLYGELKDIVK